MSSAWRRVEALDLYGGSLGWQADRGGTRGALTREGAVAIDRLALDAALQHLRELVPERWEGLDELLQQTIKGMQDLFRLTGAGVMIIDTGQVLRSVAATSKGGHVLEQAQQEVGDGPCIEAFVYDRIFWTDDVKTDERWPEVGRILCGHGVRAVMGVPIKIGGGPVGVLNVYVDREYEWTAEDRRALEGFAMVLATLLSAGVAVHRSDMLAQQLQYALDYRVVIERGIGYLMAQEHVDALTAFGRLRKAARDSRRKVGDIAAELLQGKALG